MFHIINGFIASHELAHQILEEGFKCLGEHSPFQKEVILSKRLSAAGDSIVWMAYNIEGNENWIKGKEEGVFEIDHRAKEFASISSHEGFMQIQCGIKAFNHLAAIDFFRNL